MKARLIWVTLLGAALALLMFAGVMPASAAAANTFPGGAALVDNQTHSIAPDSALWYRFDYAGDRSSVTLTLNNGTNSGVGFNVFTPAQVGDWWNEAPIGRGTAQAITCDTGTPETNGACSANDLTWVGAFPESGTYYIQVVNSNDSAATFQLLIQGSGVTLAAPAAVSGAGSAPAAGTAAAPKKNTPAPSTAAGTNVDPGHAVVMDNSSHTLPANGSLWYRFDYAGDRSTIMLTLANGAGSGLDFNVFTPAQIGDWWDEHPIGRGTAQAINCDTGEPEPGGACQSNDLTWVGDFNASGTYYVQVVNNNSTPTLGQLTIQGDGVTLAK